MVSAICPRNYLMQYGARPRFPLATGGFTQEIAHRPIVTRAETYDNPAFWEKAYHVWPPKELRTSKPDNLHHPRKRNATGFAWAETLYALWRVIARITGP